MPEVGSSEKSRVSTIARSRWVGILRVTGIPLKGRAWSCIPVLPLEIPSIASSSARWRKVLEMEVQPASRVDAVRQ